MEDHHQLVNQDNKVVEKDEVPSSQDDSERREQRWSVVEWVYKE